VLTAVSQDAGMVFDASPDLGARLRQEAGVGTDEFFLLPVKGSKCDRMHKGNCSLLSTCWCIPPLATASKAFALS